MQNLSQDKHKQNSISWLKNGVTTATEKKMTSGSTISNRLTPNRLPAHFAVQQPSIGSMFGSPPHRPSEGLRTLEAYKKQSSRTQDHFFTASSPSEHHLPKPRAKQLGAEFRGFGEHKRMSQQDSLAAMKIHLRSELPSESQSTARLPSKPSSSVLTNINKEEVQPVGGGSSPTQSAFEKYFANSLSKVASDSGEPSKLDSASLGLMKKVVGQPKVQRSFTPLGGHSNREGNTDFKFSKASPHADRRLSNPGHATPKSTLISCNEDTFQSRVGRIRDMLNQTQGTASSPQTATKLTDPDYSRGGKGMVSGINHHTSPTFGEVAWQRQNAKTNSNLAYQDDSVSPDKGLPRAGFANYLNHRPALARGQAAGPQGGENTRSQSSSEWRAETGSIMNRLQADSSTQDGRSASQHSTSTYFVQKSSKPETLARDRNLDRINSSKLSIVEMKDSQSQLNNTNPDNQSSNLNLSQAHKSSVRFPLGEPGRLPEKPLTPLHELQDTGGLKRPGSTKQLAPWEAKVTSSKSQLHFKLASLLAPRSTNSALLAEPDTGFGNSIDTSNRKPGFSSAPRYSSCTNLGKLIGESYFEKIASKQYLSLNKSTFLKRFMDEVRDQLRTLAYLSLPTVPIQKVRLPIRGFHSRSRTVYLDLDETLVHTEVRQDRRNLGLSDYHRVLDLKDESIGVLLRPGAIEFLEKLSHHFELVLFTAANQEYADLVTDTIDPQRKWITSRLYRHHCTPIDGRRLSYGSDSFVKDIRGVTNRTLKDSLIVDNLLSSFAATPTRGILIYPYMGAATDTELDYLGRCLMNWHESEDSETFLRRELGQREFLDYLQHSTDKL